MYSRVSLLEIDNNSEEVGEVNYIVLSQEDMQNKEDFSMCYNCGCGMPNNDMGKPENITTKKFEEAAKAMGQSAKDAEKNAHELLAKVLAAKEQSQDKNWRP